MEFEKLTDDGLKEKTEAFAKRAMEGESLDDLLPEAFANCREAARRALGLRAFDVQLMGGIFLHQGNIAEMKTGEGKTLVATFPAYLNALTGKGVHVVTVNDYLAKRDAATGRAARLLAQLDPGDLVLIGARPGEGKTVLALEILAEAAAAGQAASFLTLEYSGETVRDLLAETGLEGRAIKVDTSDGICAGHIVETHAAAPTGAACFGADRHRPSTAAAGHPSCSLAWVGHRHRRRRSARAPRRRPQAAQCGRSRGLQAERCRRRSGRQSRVARSVRRHHEHAHRARHSPRSRGLCGRRSGRVARRTNSLRHR